MQKDQILFSTQKYLSVSLGAEGAGEKNDLSSSFF